MDHVAEVRMAAFRKHPAGGPPRPVGADEELADHRVEAVVGLRSQVHQPG